MFYEAELRLLRETFRKCRIQTAIADLSQPLGTELGLHAFIAESMNTTKPLHEYVPPVAPATVYQLRDPFDCRYIYFLLPELSGQAILVIGPYLSASPTKQQIMEWSEGRNISPAHQQHLESYYSNIPILPDTSHLLLLLDAFCERLWGINGYSVEDINQDSVGIISPLGENRAVSAEKDTLWDMETMEQRYHYENQLMDAVSKGQTHKADLLLSGFSSFSFEQRVTDPLRNSKNYCIVMNTLLRKAAERGGVHPLYLDSTSSSYATRLEQALSLDAIAALVPEMFRAYCRLVRTHSMKDYSPPVQKALTYIDANLSSNLSLSVLADALNISSGYLSTLFKKETGQTVTEYITGRRIKHAMHLLDTTRLQIQTVAQHCGIIDVQYFSKVFKRIAGMTPKEYRDHTKR